MLIANTAGAGDDPNLNGITLEMEACLDPQECMQWFKDQEKQTRASGCVMRHSDES